MNDVKEIYAKIAVGVSLVTSIIAVAGIIWLASGLASQTKFAYDFAMMNQQLPTRMIVAEAQIDKFNLMAADVIRVQTRQEALFDKYAGLMARFEALEGRLDFYYKIK